MEPRHADIFAAILVGGQGKRMGGVDKARLRSADSERTFLERLVSALTPCVHEVLLAGRPDQAYPEIACRLVPDLTPGGGPLSGLEAVLAEARVPWCFLVACDMPWVTGEVLEALVAERREAVLAVVPRHGERLQPTCALYHRRAGERVTAVRAGGDASMHALIAAVPHAEVELPARLSALLRNVNREADLNAVPPA